MPTTFLSRPTPDQLALAIAPAAIDTTQSTSIVLRKTQAVACEPLTSASLLDQFYRTVKTHQGTLLTVINSLTVYNLNMAPFAHVANQYTAYVSSISQTMCIGPSNAVAYDALERLILQTNDMVLRGISTFETNLTKFASGAVPLLNALLATCLGINAASRDFNPVADATARYNSFTTPYNINFFALSPSIAQTADIINDLSAQAAQVVEAARAQLEVNVEREAEVIVQKASVAKDLLRYWDEVDGETAYQSYQELLKYNEEVLVPGFSDLLQKVPTTPRISAATARVEQALNYITDNFNAFPTFQALPAANETFPYLSYGGGPRRKYGGRAIIAALQFCCLSYFQTTGRRLYIGDMQLEHGGRIANSPHRSHKSGIDADVDVFEAGDWPGAYDVQVGLMAAQLFLQAGAMLVFHAQPEVIEQANAWAQQNGIAGRLQFEQNHNRHFHLRMG